jgi:phosphoserine phosphatase
MEKVNRLNSLLGELTEYRLYVYGDSSGDKEMLAIADKPYYRTFVG